METSTGARAVDVLPPGKVGVWVFLASEILLFGGLISSYTVSRLGGLGWSGEAAHLNVSIAAVNTLVLLTSSLTMVLAFAAVEKADRRGLRTFLALTILLGLTFLGIKAYEYSSKVAAGLTPGAGPFWSFYYTMTGLHALHVLAGVIINSSLFVMARASLRQGHRVELAGLYWHFVDIVWLFLFPLLYLT